METLQDAEHPILLGEGAVGVGGVECRLLEEILSQHLGHGEGDTLLRRQGVGPEKLDDAFQLLCISQQLECPRSLLTPVFGDVVVEPLVGLVQRVATRPVDCRIVAPSGQVGVQGPEGAGQPEAVLGDRLGEVAPGRRDGADDRDRATALVLAQGDHCPGTLVELGEAGGQIRRESLFAGQLFQPAGDLSEGLTPTTRGVGEHGHVVSLIPVVLGDGDSRVDARLAGCHGHIRRVGDYHRALDQRRATLRVQQSGELLEHLGELVAPLSATYEDDHIGVGMPGDGLLQHGLARAEATGQCGAAAAGNREQRVADTLTRDQWRDRVESARHRATSAHRPDRHCGHDRFPDPRNRVLDGDLRLPDRGYLATHVRGDEDAMLYGRGLVDRGDDVTGSHMITDRHEMVDMPRPLTIQCGNLDATADERLCIAPGFPGRARARVSGHRRRSLR